MAGVWVLILAFLAPASAQAQTQLPRTAAEAREEAKWTFGPFHVTPGVRLKGLGWDSNVFNDVRGEAKSDFTFTLAPRGVVAVPIGNRALISTGLELDMLWYAEYKNQRSINPLSNTHAALFLNRLTVDVGYEHLDTRDRPSNEIDLRVKRVERTVRLALDYRLTRRFSLTASGDRRASDYEDAEFLGENLEQNLDRFSGRAGLTANFALTPLTTVKVAVDRGSDRFELAPDRDSDSWTVMPRIEFKPRALIHGTAAAGFRWFLPEEGSTLRPFRGLVLDTGLGYTWRGSTQVTLTWRRGVSYSFTSENPYYIGTQTGLAVQHMLGRSFDILVSTDRHLYDYRPRITLGPDVNPSPGADHDDYTWSSSGSLGYRIGRDGRIGVGVLHWLRRSETRRVADYERLQFTVAFSYGT